MRRKTHKRYRAKEHLDTRPGTLWYRPIGSPEGVNETEIPVLPKTCFVDVSTMFDTVGLRKSQNPCQHAEIHFKRVAWPKGWVDWNIIRLSDPYPIRLGPNELQYILPTNHGKSAEFSAFCDDSFFRLTEQVPPVMDGLYLVQDLLTIKGLARNIRKTIERGFDLFKSLNIAGRFFGQGRGHTLPDLAKWMADTHLGTIFGVMPLLGEVEAAASQVFELGKRLEFLRKTQGKAFVTYARGGTTPEFQAANYVSEGHPDALQKWYAYPTSGKISYHVSMAVENRLSGLDGFLGELAALQAELGFSRAASFAWDLVPFSFVADWFLHIGDLLDKYATIQPFTGELRVLNATHSVKCEYRWDVTFWPAAAYSNPEQILGHLTYKSYERGLGLPANVGTLLNGDLSVHQLAILTSLLVQRSV